jgi:hypothetical protein
MPLQQSLWDRMLTSHDRMIFTHFGAKLAPFKRHPGQLTTLMIVSSDTSGFPRQFMVIRPQK